MAKKDIHPSAQSVALVGDSGAAVLLIHGYTGSPTDFNKLPKFLNENYGISVFVPLLPGHGTQVEDLVGLTKDDFIKVAKQALEPLLAKYDEVFIGGHSFGGQVALHLAARYPALGVFTTTLPYKLFFPFDIPFFYELYSLLPVNKFSDKGLSKEELERRKGAFFYTSMPAYSVKLLNEMNKDLKKLLPLVKCPFLSIFLKEDTVSHPKSGSEVMKLVGSDIKKTIMLDQSGHGLFYSENAPRIYNEIAEFFKFCIIN